MTERYWITGAQLGMLVSQCKFDVNSALRLLKEIEDNQFIGNMKEPYGDYEIVIVKVKKNGKQKG